MLLVPDVFIQGQCGDCNLCFGQVLGKTDFKAVDKSLVDVAGRQIFFEQSAGTQETLLALVTIVPAIGFLLTIIPMVFNDYTGKTKENAQKELEKARLEKSKRCKLLSGETPSVGFRLIDM